MNYNINQLIKWLATFGNAPYKVIVRFLSIYLIIELIKLTINWYEITVRKQIDINVNNERNEFNNKYTVCIAINVINIE